MSDESRKNPPVNKTAEAGNVGSVPAKPASEARGATSLETSWGGYSREVGLLARVERLVCLRADEARVKSAHLAESQNELIQLVRAVRDLSKTAASITRKSQFLSMAAANNLQPAACAVILLARILRHVYALSSTTKDSVNAQSATMRELTEIVGEAAQVSSYLTGKVAALAEETRSVLPALSKKSFVDAELQCVTGELEKVLTEFRGPHATPKEGIEAVTPQQPAKPQAVN
jgi:hypothetical protein